MPKVHFRLNPKSLQFMILKNLWEVSVPQKVLNDGSQGVNNLEIAATFFEEVDFDALEKQEPN